jgi:hypothetical protein
MQRIWRSWPNRHRRGLTSESIAGSFCECIVGGMGWASSVEIACMCEEGVAVSNLQQRTFKPDTFSIPVVYFDNFVRSIQEASR